MTHTTTPDHATWDKWPNFQPHEFACSHTGRVFMDAQFLDMLQNLRNLYGFPLVITSGYRSPLHPREAAKQNPGPHTTGRAADIRCQGQAAHHILHLALHVGFTGIGLHQHGVGRFMHLDNLPPSQRFKRPTIWTY